MHKDIDFDLKKSHLVGLIKQGHCLEAIEYATQNIAPIVAKDVCNTFISFLFTFFAFIYCILLYLFGFYIDHFNILAQSVVLNHT